MINLAKVLFAVSMAFLVGSGLKLNPENSKKPSTDKVRTEPLDTSPITKTFIDQIPINSGARKVASELPARSEFRVAEKLVYDVMSGKSQPKQLKVSLERLNSELVYITLIYLRAQERIDSDMGNKSKLISELRSVYQDYEIAAKLVGPEVYGRSAVIKFNDRYLNDNEGFRKLGSTDFPALLNQTFYSEL